MLRIPCVTCLHFGGLVKNAFGANKVRLPNSFYKKFCGFNSELTPLVYYWLRITKTTATTVDNEVLLKRFSLEVYDHIEKIAMNECNDA